MKVVHNLLGEMHTMFIRSLLLACSLQHVSGNADSIGFTLIDAAQDIPIAEISLGETIFLDELSSKELSIRADVDNTSNEVIESVSFSDSNQQLRTERVPPYTLGGDINGDYSSVDWLTEEGQKAVSVSVLYASGRTETDDIVFWVVNESRAPVQSGGASAAEWSAGVTKEDLQQNSTTNIGDQVYPPPTEPVVGQQSAALIVPPIATPVSTPSPIATSTGGNFDDQEASNEYSAVDCANPFVEDNPDVVITGEMRIWHKITLAFLNGPMTSETATPNPFTDYRLDVTFINGEEKYVVPGYFAADGDAANTGASSGTVWHCHFSPSLRGKWTWRAQFVVGPGVATPMDPGSATSTHFNGVSGSLMILETNKSGRDLRGKDC